MSREVLEQMTKEELVELVNRQNELIDSLDLQRYDAASVIEHLVRVTSGMHNLRNNDAKRSHDQDYLDDWVQEMYRKHPLYIYPQDVATTEADKEEVNADSN